MLSISICANGIKNGNGIVEAVRRSEKKKQPTSDRVSERQRRGEGGVCVTELRVYERIK